MTLRWLCAWSTRVLLSPLLPPLSLMLSRPSLLLSWLLVLQLSSLLASLVLQQTMAGPVASALPESDAPMRASVQVD